MEQRGTKKIFDVVCLGRIMVDILFTNLPRTPVQGEEVSIQTYSIDVGGGAAITAMALAKLGYRTAIASATGNDVFGKFLQQSLVKSNVDLTCLHICHDKPTTLSVEFSFPTDRATVTASVFHDGILNDALLKRQLAASRHLHIHDLNESRVQLLEFAISSGLTTSVDTNLNREGQQQFVKRGAAFIDLLMPNRNEVPTPADDLRATAEMLGCDIRGYCIVKAGREGAVASDGHSFVHAGAFSVPVVDTTGAGDAFDAGFLYAFLKGYALEQCLAIGNGMGSCNVSTIGGTHGLPTLGQLHAFMSEQGVNLHM